MRLKLKNIATGKKFAIGNLPYAPNWVYYHESVRRGSVDGHETEFLANSRSLSKTVVFQHPVTKNWHYFSDGDLAERIRYSWVGQDKPLNIDFTSEEFTPAKRRRRIDALDHLWLGQPAGEMLGSSEKASGENNDCTVRSLAIASERSYDEAHEILSSWRQRGKGFPLRIFMASKEGAEFEAVKLERTITLGTIAKEYPTGRYIVTVPGHALNLIDGKIIDWSLKPNRKVRGLYRFIGKRS